MVEYYFQRLEYYKKLRNGKGYSQSDFKKAQKDVNEWIKINKLKN